MVPLSILDLCPIIEGGDAAQALRHSLQLAQCAERHGYTRFWLAEHHNMPGIASAATAVVIAHIAAGTQRIRVGSGGIMLPNHAPLIIAEQFGTLAALHPGRIDLGLGRAPGTDQLTARALRREPHAAAEQFPHDVVELQALLEPLAPEQVIRAIPGAGSRVPLWLLGSSLYSAQLAAHLGLPFAFASHFAPDHLLPALRIYRERFQPSAQCAQPYTMAAVNVLAADSDEEARYQFTSRQLATLQMHRNRRGLVPPPVRDIDAHWSPSERAGVEHHLTYSYVGNPDTVRAGLQHFLDLTGVDEIMVTAHLYSQEARLRSLELTAGIREQLRRPEKNNSETNDSGH